MEIQDTLEQLDLSPREASAYKACVELGMTPIMPLVHKTGIPRSSLGYIMEQLRKRGFISVVLKRSRHYYVPNSPQNVAKILRLEMEKASQRLQTFEQGMEELSSLYRSTAVEASIRVYRGLEMRECYEQLLIEGADEILNIGDTDSIFNALGKQFWLTWSKERARKGIKARAIRRRDQKFLDIDTHTDRALKRAVRYTPHTLPLPAHIAISGNTVAILSTDKEGIGYTITSRDFSLTMKSIFKELWKASEKN